MTDQSAESRRPDRTSEADTGTDRTLSRSRSDKAAASRSSKGSGGGRRRTVVRAATSSDDPGRELVRLGVTTFTTAVSFTGLLALGAIAGRVGADVWLGVGAMHRSLGELFVTGVRMPLVMLDSLYRSGVANPLFFAAAMALLIPPIAALAAARPNRSGGRRPEGAVLAAGRLAAALVVVADIGIGVRLSWRSRPTFPDTGIDGTWLDELRALSAADGITMVFAILLAILVFRIPVDRWIRRLTGTIAIATAVAATVSAAASGGIVGAVEASRPVVRTMTVDGTVDGVGTGPDRILVGTTADGRDLLLATDDPTIRLMEPAAARVVVGTTTIAEAFENAD